MSEALQVVQITDTHLFANPAGQLLGLTTAVSLQTVLTAVGEQLPRPDLLLLTGDLSQDESLAAYQQLKSLVFALEIPSYWLPGNHDCLENIKTALTEAPLCSTQPSFQQGGWQFLLLNSQVPGQVLGALSAASLNWLDQQLQQCLALPTLVALHHPPFSVQSRWLDSSSLQNPEELFRVLDRYPQVKLVLCGHVHQEFSYQRQGTLYLSTPSTCIQFQPQSQKFGVDPTQPGYRWLSLYPNGEFTTEVVRVPLPVTQELNLASGGY